MLRRISIFLFACSLLPTARGETPPDIGVLARQFADPPATAMPWVYWTWIDGNISKESVTADLEAMRRVGIGGALVIDVDQSTPHGPVHFFDDQWQALFRHAVHEAKRLGMELNMNDGAGYYGSGGWWVPPEKGMQTVVSSEVHVVGGAPRDIKLPRPVPNPEYRDVAVVAVGEKQKSKYRIPDLTMKSLQWKSWIAYRGTESAPLDAAAPAESVIPLEHVVDLTGRMDGDGKIGWDAPPGDWTVIRFGHAYNGHIVGPSPRGEAGPETDKLDKSATALHFDAFVKRLNDVVGPEREGVLVATHIDSWEGGGQNWTAAMRDEFKRRRGYDPVPYLPVLTGRVLGDLQITERFLFDLRRTVSDLMVENYSAEFQRLAHESGLRGTFESYTTIGNDLDNAMFTDEPMAEFWTPNGQGLDFQPTVKSMSSAAHLARRSVVGAESFTSGAREKFLWHPAMLKAIGDNAFCGGVNRMVFHRYAAQPFEEGVKPGMQMGPWGLHYERTNTWWEFSGPWHAYLARCQYLLRQGESVDDVLKVESEEPLHRFQNFALVGYDYDACGPDTFLRTTAKDGRVVFPNGRSYRLVVLPSTPTMSLPMLRHVRDLVQAGATVLGDPPVRTPGLTDYPRSDADLKIIADTLWTADRQAPGHVLRGISPERVMASLGVDPDFTSDADLKYIHRTAGDADVYFLSHPGTDPVVARCAFRVGGKQPQLWDPQTGAVTPIRAYSPLGPDGTRITIPFESTGSAFIVFAGVPTRSRLDRVTNGEIPVLDGGLLLPLPPQTRPPVDPVTGDIHEPGNYALTGADGVSRSINTGGLGRAEVAGPWTVRFPAGQGAPAEARFDDLQSWSLRPEPAIRYFSGTATYAKSVSPPVHGPGQRVYLDLGRVQVMARVRLNGKDLGVLWKSPYRVDATDAVKPGENALEIDVVNLWVNRLIGDEQLAEDSDRNPNGTLKSWPQWLLDGKPSPSGRVTFSSWRLWKKSDPLQESGLLGPVAFATVQQTPPAP